MAVRCVNTNLKEVKDLAEELKLPIGVVAAKIAIWQDNNKTEDFPKSEDFKVGDKHKQSLREAIGIPKSEINFDKLANQKQKVAKYNKDNKTNYRLDYKKIGESQLVKTTLIDKNTLKEVIDTQEQLDSENNNKGVSLEDDNTNNISNELLEDQDNNDIKDTDLDTTEEEKLNKYLKHCFNA